MLCVGRLRSTLTWRDVVAVDGALLGVVGSVGGLDLTRFFVSGFCGSGDLPLSSSSASHLERFFEGVDGPASGSSEDMVVGGDDGQEHARICAA